MPDVVDRATRSRMMSGIRGVNTQPELIVRSGLHRAGFRFRLHDRCLPGKPDMVLPKYRAVILVHGCFWHMHDCHLFKWPTTRNEFWRRKLRRNSEVDATAVALLLEQGWRVLTIWECSLKGKRRLPAGQVVAEAADWIRSGSGTLVIEGARGGLI